MTKWPRVAGRDRAAGFHALPLLGSLLLTTMVIAECLRVVGMKRDAGFQASPLPGHLMLSTTVTDKCPRVVGMGMGLAAGL